MAAGIVYHNITTSTGVTFSLACWVPDTAAPDVGAIPVSIPVSLAGVPLGKLEDAAHASGDGGMPAWAVRRDTAASGCADGDYASLNTDDLGNLRVHIDDRQLDGNEWETVAASTTAILGAAGATGDYLREILVIPSTLNPGKIQIKDGAGSAIDVFNGGTGSIVTLHPFTISLGLTSLAGGWSIITLAGATAIGIGNFT